jgi:hypothetical protein
MFAFSSGRPAEIFDVQEDWLRPESLTATANTGFALKVAVAKNDFGLDLDDDEWPESVAAAYEEFVDDPEMSDEHFEWITL